MCSAKSQGTKLDTHRSAVFLWTSDEPSENEIKKNSVHNNKNVTKMYDICTQKSKKTLREIT